MNNTIRNIDKAEHVHTLLVVSVKVIKLKCSFEVIYIIKLYYKIILYIYIYLINIEVLIYEIKNLNLSINTITNSCNNKIKHTRRDKFSFSFG